MAKKSLILDNGDGRVAFSNTSSVSLDDGAGSNMSASYMTVGSLKLSGVGVGQTKLLSASNGTFSTFPDGTVNGGAIAFDGSRWITSSILVQDYSGSAYGDLSGSYESTVQVKNISNINAGTLPVAFGGTGKSLAASQAYILKVSSSAGGTPVISALSASSGSILTTYGGAWTAIPPGYPDVRFYTSGSTGNTFTWNKPAGARFARVILQGAGGGGGGGSAATYNGAGGGSGGFTDITLNLFNTSSVTVTTGLGGTGGAFINNGGSGGTTSFGSYTAAGGGGGGLGANSTTNYGSAGSGLTKGGGYGAASVTTAGQTVYDMPSGGAAGGNSPSKGSIINLLNNKNFGYTVTSDGLDLSTLLANASGSNGASNKIIPSKPGYGAGGGGGDTSQYVVQRIAVDDSGINSATANVIIDFETKDALGLPTAIYEDSSYNRAINYSGGSSLSNTIFKTGTKSGYFSGATLSTGFNCSRLGFGTSDFTIESWVYRQQTRDNWLFDLRASASTAAGCLITIPTSNKLYFGWNNWGGFSSNATIPQDEWTHIAIVRIGSVHYMYINGVLDNTFTYAWTDAGTVAFIGYAGYSAVASRTLVGYMDRIRIHNSAIYTTNFTPSSSSYKTNAISNIPLGGPGGDGYALIISW